MLMFRAAVILALASSVSQLSAPPAPRAQEVTDFEPIVWPVGGGDDYYQGLARGLLGQVPPALAGGDPLAFLQAEVHPPGGVGDDATLRGMVTRFLAEDDPWRLLVLAQHLRVQTTRRWGTIWMIEGEPLGVLWNCVARDPLPARRALALIALQDVHGFQSGPYLADDALLVRVAAARCLAPPAAITEADAAPVVAQLLDLLANEDPSVRAIAAQALGPWIFREPDRAALELAAAADPVEQVRAAALEALGAVPCLRSRARLREVLDDSDASPSLQEAARRGLAHHGILP